MKPERLQEYATFVVALVVGIFLALYIGTSTGKGSFNSVAIIVGILAVVLALILRSKIWILIPICGSLTGKVVGLPGSFPVRDLAILYVFPVFLALIALKIVRKKVQYNWLDYVLLANFLYLVSVFIRNPAGTESMGTDIINGQYYYEIVIVMMGYWVIGHVTFSSKSIRKITLFLLAGDAVNGFLGFITHHFPSTVPVLGRVYTGIDTATYNSNNSTSSETNAESERETLSGYLGSSVLLYLYSWYRPSSTLNPMRVGRFFFSALSVFLILKSGYRTMLFSAGLFFALSTYFRNGISGLFKTLFIIVPLIGLLLFAQSFVALPAPIQRTLSFLPGEWDQDAVQRADDSTEWRLDMWKKVWGSNKYIKNWWLGDGCGVSRIRLKESSMIPNTGENAKENLMIFGAYHSLPLSAIHTVGYVGFAMFLVLLFGTAVYAWKLIVKVKGSPFFPIALFAGINPIIVPPTTLILTGFYNNQFVALIYSVAMLRLIDRSFQKYKAEEPEKLTQPQPYGLLSSDISVPQPPNLY